MKPWEAYLNYAQSQNAHLSRAQRISRLEKLASFMDNRFYITGFPIAIGWDSILGLIPGIGDTLTMLVSAYIIKEAKELGASRYTRFRMVKNAGIDWLIGSIPLIGDIFDVGWKANLKNLELLRKDLARYPEDKVVIIPPGA